MALEQELDLLLIAPNSVPPVCKIVDYGQFRYEQKKKDKQSKKASKAQIIKELKLTPKISANDYMVRLNSGIKFLQKGYKIKLSVFFKGREMTHPEIGRAVLTRYLEEIKPYGLPETDIVQSNRSLIVILNPKS